MSNPILELNALGQSLWYDNIRRGLLRSGELAGLIQRGEIRGVTSNPAIFNQAIGKSQDYDSALIPLAKSGCSAEEIFWRLAVEDIQAVALPILRHRIIVNHRAVGDSVTSADLIGALLKNL